MASMVREFAGSALRQLRQPRWNRLLLKSNINLHLPAIHQQRRFSQCPDEGGEDQEQKKCIDYKKNPTIEGHEPPELPKLQPADPKLKIAKRREFLRKKECEERGRELERERKEAEGNDSCDNFSRASFVWGKPRVRISLVWHKINTCLTKLSKLQTLHSDPVCLNQERTFCRKVEQGQAFLAPGSSVQPVPSRSKEISQKRMAIKRSYLQAKKKKEAKAKAQALKHACSYNSQTKNDFKNTQSNSELVLSQEADPVLVSAKPEGETFTNQVELKELLKIIKERCRRKCEEFEKAREAESKREAEEAALRKQAKLSKIRKICTEAKKLSSSKMAKLTNICKESHLRQQSVEAKLGNETKEITSEDKSRVTAANFKKEYSEDDQL